MDRDKLRDILLAEDDPRDVELTLTALHKHRIANRVIVVRDGASALDYLYRRGEFGARDYQLRIDFAYRACM